MNVTVKQNDLSDAPVQVGVRVLRHVVVEDDVDALDVHASAEEICGHEDSLHGSEGGKWEGSVRRSSNIDGKVDKRAARLSICEKRSMAVGVIGNSVDRLLDLLLAIYSARGL